MAGLALGGRLSAFLGPLAGSFVLDVADRQPQQLHHGGVVREVSAVLGDLAELVVQGLHSYLESGASSGL